MNWTYIIVNTAEWKKARTEKEFKKSVEYNGITSDPHCDALSISKRKENSASLRKVHDSHYAINHWKHVFCPLCDVTQQNEHGWGSNSNLIEHIMSSKHGILQNEVQDLLHLDNI